MEDREEVLLSPPEELEVSSPPMRARAMPVTPHTTPVVEARKYKGMVTGRQATFTTRPPAEQATFRLEDSRDVISFEHRRA